MKTLAQLFISLFCMIGLASCYTGIPLKSGKSENNRTYEVSYLFEHDGIKVYRFFDMGNYVYFTTRGDVTSIKNDSTGERTITTTAWTAASPTICSFTTRTPTPPFPCRRGVWKILCISTRNDAVWMPKRCRTDHSLR